MKTGLLMQNGVLVIKTFSMKYSLMVNGSSLKSVEVNKDFVQEPLEVILQKLYTEISARQRTIEFQEEQIRRSVKIIEEKDNHLHKISEKMNETLRHNEGNKQLINKLLGDIEKLNQDIEWYKRTYEKRSLLGTIKEKLFRNGRDF